MTQSEKINEIIKALEYRSLTEVFDGSLMIEALNLYLDPGSAILELGMGPGKDMDILSTKHRVTGSDVSQVFLDIYKEDHPDADLLLLDASAINTHRRFDCIYSNKVLHQLSKEKLLQSYQRQWEILNNKGLTCHSFWYGDKVVVAKGQKFHYYNEKTLQAFYKDKFEVVLQSRYMEMIPGDSMLIILKKCS